MHGATEMNGRTTSPAAPARPEPQRPRVRLGPSIPELLDDTTFDLLVIGAGINGSGIARDAALRGLKVLLLDMGDIASGTTSWSSRLIHGGLRYLEYGEVGLVRESLHERETLLHTAAHLVHPLPLMIPIYEHDRRGKRLVKLGMIGYDVLSTGKSLDRHRMLSKDEAIERAPGLEPDELEGAALYFDAQVEYAERLAVENALDAMAHGAVVLTYCRVDDLVIEDGAVRGALFTDLLDGGTYTARARLTINVTGPWVDATLGHPAPERLEAEPAPGNVTTSKPEAEAAAPPKESFLSAGERFVRGFMAQFHSSGPEGARLIGGTKGSHIIVAPFPGAPHDALYVEAQSDGRPFFIIPWNHLFLIGTTDIRYEGNLDHVVASDAEIDYLVSETNRVLPSAELTRDKVLYTYSGVRPLPYQDDDRTGAITRRHLVHDHAPEMNDLISIVGGKLTTFRELAEQTVDLAMKKLGMPPVPSRTAETPLPGSVLDGEPIDQDAVEDLPSHYRQRNPSFLDRTIAHLVDTYGTRTGDILAMASADPALAEVVDTATGAIAAEVAWVLEREDAQTLTDIMLRRMMIGYGPSNGVGSDVAIAGVAGRIAGWDEARQRDEVKRYRDFIERYRPRALSQAQPISAP